MLKINKFYISIDKFLSDNTKVNDEIRIGMKLYILLFKFKNILIFKSITY